jgi:peptidoglycan/xylan/chitin deacetylase (PgdA/CDA1 family)
MAWLASPQLDGPHRRAESASPVAAPPTAAAALREPGWPIDPETRRLMETRFGRDFSNVRVHTGPAAAASARELDAPAYTVGRHLVFGDGSYAPETAGGRALLAHELAHSVQEGGLASEPHRALEVEPRGSAAERLAETVARGVRRGPSAGAAAAVGRPAVGRLLRATRNFELTFDDGPHTAELGKGKNRTEKVLDTLKAKGSIKAGFFIQTGVSYRGASAVGRQLVARMHKEGHTVGIHTGGKKDHELHTEAEKPGRLEGELKSAKQYVKDVTGEEATLVRPPTGKSDNAVEATYGKVGLTNLLWDIDGDGGGSLSLADLKDRFTKQLSRIAAGGWKPGRKRDAVVVLYHDIQKGTADNIGAIVDHIKNTTSKLSSGKESAAFRAP